MPLPCDPPSAGSPAGRPGRRARSSRRRAWERPASAPRSEPRPNGRSRRRDRRRSVRASWAPVRRPARGQVPRRRSTRPRGSPWPRQCCRRHRHPGGLRSSGRGVPGFGRRACGWAGRGGRNRAGARPKGGRCRRGRARRRPAGRPFSNTAETSSTSSVSVWTGRTSSERGERIAWPRHGRNWAAPGKWKTQAASARAILQGAPAARPTGHEATARRRHANSRAGRPGPGRPGRRIRSSRPIAAAWTSTDSCASAAATTGQARPRIAGSCLTTRSISLRARIDVPATRICSAGVTPASNTGPSSRPAFWISPRAFTAIDTVAGIGLRRRCR